MNDSARNCPSVWFLILERARNFGDRNRELEARAELRRLGVEIRYRRNTKKAAGDANAGGRE